MKSLARVADIVTTLERVAMPLSPDETPVQLLRPDEAAARLACGQRWLLDQARAGRVPARRLGRFWRFSEADLAAIAASASRGTADLNPWRLSARSGGLRRRRASMADRG